MPASPFVIVDMTLKAGHKEPLTAKEMTAVMEQIVAGGASDTQIEEFLLAMRDKGETVDELVAAVKVMRKHAVALPAVVSGTLDTCGTGGDHQNTLNVSTLSALVVSAAGVQVAKHGNRSVSSVCGSADLLELLGVRIDLPPQKVMECLRETGFGFFFAPNFHPATRHAMPARKKIKGKTLFNLLGPLANPAGCEKQLIGVYEKRLVTLFAKALKKLGSQRAMVVHGENGLDEISLSGKTFVAELKDNEISEHYIRPEDFNLKEEPIENLRVHSKEEGLSVAQKVLNGDNNAASKIVCLNAAAAFVVAEKSKNMKEGLWLAMNILNEGKAVKKLKQIVEFSQKA